MTTKKVILIIVGIVAVLGFVVVLFAGGTVWFIFRGIANSEAADEARAYLRRNDVLKSDIGEVKDFGSFVTGSINVTGSDGMATLSLKVIGERKTVNATVDLQHRRNQAWRVTGATYERDGRTVDLMQAYEPEPSPD